MERSFDLAVRNIARWGDTDVFPFAPENHVLHDNADKVVALLTSIHSDFKSRLRDDPPTTDVALQLVTNEGFRWATQLDPVWNAYLLGLVLESASAIERNRAPSEDLSVFSYRFDIDEDRASLFRADSWLNFSKRSEELAKKYSHVVVADIADFYARIYHHRIENSLLELRLADGEVPKRINLLLGSISGGVSYGLPVGGPAARALSEITLDRVDKLLAMDGIAFCRFADDYRIFATSEAEAYSHLISLTQYLHEHEGATLQKQKTRVVRTRDFLRAPIFLAEDSPDLSATDREERRFVRLSLRFDPYSQDAAEEYERLRKELEDFDIVDMLSREVGKSRVNLPVVRRLTQALGFVDADIQEAAIGTIVDSLEMLAPAMPVVLRVLDDLAADLSSDTISSVTSEIRRRIVDGSYFMNLPMNLAYGLRVLRHEQNAENLILAKKIYSSSQAPPFLQRDIVLHMHNWRSSAFISAERRHYQEKHPWVKRAILLSSFLLDDEGAHWRRKTHFSDFDRIALKWREDKVAQGREEVPV
ncbi:RNA-directed DNA polymerase [Luteipulveratus flavus]|uniref:RNA-directed DNA polymerase n=1 Tax=Luteipulveratus flavus TaxID=3031728 RepID=A0ABT6C234_9MICO|nr:RNA-directed DNA polymerase [Luteipulveratus sp. YIM 133296]MDF8262867.1 RNA-directed DNA polymerase [Luteipulveratus sp. YIM 133296]